MPGVAQKQKILVIDDEPQVLTAIGHLLEDDFEVFTSTDPEAAVGLLEEQEIAVVLSDQRMPGFTGDDFLSRARAISDATRVLITGYADLDALGRAVNHGQIHAYMTKPWDPDRLRMVLQQAAERYQLTRALRKTQARLKSVIDHLPEGICLLDEHRNVVLANPVAQSYLALLAALPSDAPFTHIGNLSVEDIVTSPGNLPRDVRLADDRIFEVSGCTFSDDATSENGALLLLREVTQARQMQDRLALQSRLAAVGQLAAGIAHDFNNSLTSMTAGIQTLARDPDTSPGVRSHLYALVQQGREIAQVLRQLLDFNGKPSTIRQPVELRAFIEEIVGLLSRMLPDNVRIEAHFEGGPHPVLANPVQLQQVMINLAINARDAMPQGGRLRIVITGITVTPQMPGSLPEIMPGKWHIVKVSDTGEGISETRIGRIFDPFFTTKPSGRGTGLGLTQVYSIVKQHRGEIIVDSVPDKGTTFSIYLPEADDTTGFASLA